MWQESSYQKKFEPLFLRPPSLCATSNKEGESLRKWVVVTGSRWDTNVDVKKGWNLDAQATTGYDKGVSRLISLLAAARRGAKEGQEERNATKGEDTSRKRTTAGKRCVPQNQRHPPLVLDRFPP